MVSALLSGLQGKASMCLLNRISVSRGFVIHLLTLEKGLDLDSVYITTGNLRNWIVK